MSTTTRDFHIAEREALDIRTGRWGRGLSRRKMMTTIKPGDTITYRETTLSSPITAKVLSISTDGQWLYGRIIHVVRPYPPSYIRIPIHKIEPAS